MHLEFDVAALIDKLGPKAGIAEYCGVSRTAPYGWIRRGYIGSVMLARLVEYARLHDVKIDMNKLFVRRRGDWNGGG
jgi:hypothetical protein